MHNKKSKNKISKLIRRKINEGFIERWIDSIFDKAIAIRIKNNPKIKAAQEELDKIPDNVKNELIKLYKSWDNVPLTVKKQYDFMYNSKYSKNL